MVVPLLQCMCMKYDAGALLSTAIIARTKTTRGVTNRNYIYEIVGTRATPTVRGPGGPGIRTLLVLASLDNEAITER